MDARQAKHAARDWVESNIQEWPGLRGAHLVGRITVMPDHAPFPASKDVDLHLIFDEGSPALEMTGPFANILEVQHEGVPIEAGIKSVADYRSAEAVLANPEIAYHFTVPSLLYDPTGLLGRLEDPVRRDYHRRRWVLARLEHERNELAITLSMLPMARDMWGASGELMLVGYSTTYLAAALSVATIEPPRMGGRMLVHMRELLRRQGRVDLLEDALDLLGVRHVAPAQVEAFLAEAAEAFDVAVKVRERPHPFQHKLHAHLRPYFVDSCRGMIEDGYHREALSWVTPFYLSTTDVILVDGLEGERPMFAERRDALLRELGFDTVEARAERWNQAHRWYDQIFSLATDIIAAHPAVVD